MGLARTRNCSRRFCAEEPCGRSGESCIHKQLIQETTYHSAVLAYHDPHEIAGTVACGGAGDSCEALGGGMSSSATSYDGVVGFWRQSL